MTNLRTQMQAAIEEAYAGVNVTNFYVALEKVFFAGAKCGFMAARRASSSQTIEPVYLDSHWTNYYDDFEDLQKELTEPTK